MSFKKLYEINVNDKTENLQGKTYLKWSYAWAEFVKIYPDATYKIIKNENRLPYFESTIGAMVYTEITANNLTHEMWLPVMNSSFKAMKNISYTYATKNGDKAVEAYTMFDINKTIMRCLVKNIAIFGLGLYIYEGETYPEENIEFIDSSRVKILNDMIVKASVNKLIFMQHFKINSIEETPLQNYDVMISSLDKKIKTNKIDNEK